MITLRVLAELARQESMDGYDDRESSSNGNDEEECIERCVVSCLFCCLQCILACVEDIVEYFNQWAYVFAGIYGTSYLESGQKVMELFHERGVSSILSDSLAKYVLATMVFSTGIVGCGLGALLSKTHMVTLNIWVAVG